MNNLQRFVIIADGSKVIGTDSCQAFTQGAAEKKATILKELKPKGTFKVVELTPLLVALL